MCLTPVHKNALVTKKDVFCKKCLFKYHGCLYTPYQMAFIEFNRGICIQKAYRFNFESDGNICQGIHSYSRHPIIVSSKSMYPCIIPKGTQYYVGNNGDLVSLKLIIFKNKFRYWIYKIFHK